MTGESGGRRQRRQVTIHSRPRIAAIAHAPLSTPAADEDYRGNVGVILFNHSDADFAVTKGDRIAQLILEKIEVAEVAVVEELSETARGAGGFGSTGVSNGAGAGAGAVAVEGGPSAEKKHRTA